MRLFFKADALKIGWKESLDAFKPANAWFLFLVSLRALKDLYKSLFHAFFLPTALLAGLVLELKPLLSAFYITLLLRAARPSIDLKKGSYWSHIDIVDWVLFFGLLVFDGIRHALMLRQDFSGLWFLSFKIYDLLLKAFFLGNFAWLPGTHLLGVVTYVLSPFVIIWALFMLDSKSTAWEYLKAFGRAFLMMLYNYPFFLISYIGLRCILSLTYLASRPFIESVHYLPLIGWIALFAVAIPFYLCFIMSFYVKQLHEQFGLYYDR